MLKIQWKFLNIASQENLIALGVQILTVPTISLEFTKNEKMMDILLDQLLRSLSEAYNKGIWRQYFP